jgi:hypothetical protein
MLNVQINIDFEIKILFKLVKCIGFSWNHIKNILFRNS